jgi:hypothetical protein
VSAGFTLDAARRLSALGFSVLPLNGKEPAYEVLPGRKWEHLQQTRPTEDQLLHWFGNGTRRNAGLIQRDTAVIDGDTTEALEWMRVNLPSTPMKTKTARGEHWYYLRPLALPAGAIPAFFDVRPDLSIEVKRDGQYVVAPGSIHPGKPEQNIPPGHVYAEVEPWPLTLDALPTLPVGLIDDINSGSEGRSSQKSEPLPQTVSSGSRNNLLFREACRLRRLGWDEEEIVNALEVLNRSRCKPPLDTRELTSIASSAAGYPPAEQPEQPEVALSDFYAYMPAHNYLFVPSREFWPTSSVNARIAPIRSGTDEKGKPKTVPANVWLDRHRPVEQMTWAPGHPMLIENRLVSEGGWIERLGCSCVNLYRPPTIEHRDAGAAAPWLDLLRKVYPDDADHLLAWFAHRVQRPHEKVNHALVLGGAPGIGKDSILEPVKAAIGPWNFAEVSPKHLLGRFNGFVKSVILRISEARDLGDMNRYDFYEHMKVYAAAPPDVLRVDEKHTREYSVFNVCGVIITTNHETDGIYLPPDDRRHYVAWSPLTSDDFEDRYWSALYAWYADDGYRHVAAYLAQYDLSQFHAKAPPKKTEAFWSIVDANRPSEESELANVLEAAGHPEAFTLRNLTDITADEYLQLWLRDRKNRRQIPHRLKAAGYVAHRNADAKDGQWKVGGDRQTVYVKETLSVRERGEVVKELIKNHEVPPAQAPLPTMRSPKL